MSGVEIPAELHGLLSGTPIGFVTTMRPDGRMSTNPVALLFEDGHILISTTKDRRKYRNLRADDRITVCVVQPDNLNRYLEVRGRAELHDDPERAVINRVAKRYMNADEYPFDRPGQERVTITVVAEAVSSPPIPLSDKPPYMKD
jgi:PPOX class probable F420-dependent enzyme